MDGLAERLRVAEHIEHIVPDLERQPQRRGILRRRVILRRAPVPRDHTAAARRADQRAGLQILQCINMLRVRRLLLLGREVEHLPAHHAELARRPGQCLHRSGDDRRVRAGVRQRLKRRRQQRVSREHRRRLTEHLVVCQLAAPVIVVVHARQIVVDQAVRVHHLHRRRDRHRLLPVSAAHPAEFQRQHGPDALSACE